jgi:hypothetical protein
VVGEKGPELFIPDRAGTIIPNGSSGRGGRESSGGGGGLTVHFNSLWPPTPEMARQVADIVDEHLYYRRAGQSR